MPLKFIKDGRPFSQGGAGYNTVPGYELSEYIVAMIQIQSAFGDAVIHEAAVDTSSPYLVLTRDVAENVGLLLAEPEARGKARIQGVLVEGAFHIVLLTLLSDPGKGNKSVTQDAWAFVPDNPKFDPDPLPPVLLGLKRCLDSFCFAVDPFQQMFYFG
jgi:hypothetical protein